MGQDRTESISLPFETILQKVLQTQSPFLGFHLSLCPSPMLLTSSRDPKPLGSASILKSWPQEAPASLQHTAIGSQPCIPALSQSNQNPLCFSLSPGGLPVLAQPLHEPLPQATGKGSHGLLPMPPAGLAGYPGPQATVQSIVSTLLGPETYCGPVSGARR